MVQQMVDKMVDLKVAKKDMILADKMVEK